MIGLKDRRARALPLRFALVSMEAARREPSGVARTAECASARFKLGVVLVEAIVASKDRRACALPLRFALVSMEAARREPSGFHAPPVLHSAPVLHAPPGVSQHVLSWVSF